MGDLSHPNHLFCEATVALDNFEGKLRLKMKLSFPQLGTPISWKQPATCVCIKLMGMMCGKGFGKNRDLAYFMRS
jgi:hypothetical protein